MAKREPRPPTPRNPWLPAIAAACVLGVVVIAGISGGGKGDASSPTTVDPADGAIDVSLTAPASTQPAVVVDTAEPVVKTTIPAPLKRGMFGDDVKQLQQRLADLKFAPGPVDGLFGEDTQQAVWAWKKLIGGMSWQDLNFSESATTVTPDLWSQMQDPVTINPRRPLGAGTTHVEIYLPLQVLIVFTDDTPTLIAHIASGQLDEQGNPVHWCEVVKYNTDNQGRPLAEEVERDECADSKTPGGIFKFNHRVAGNRLGPLGGMYNPVYFNFGIAVHGALNVPRAPASHGCIRVNMDIAEYFPSLVKNGNRVYVWGHDGKEPENYSSAESKPSFNAPNPNSTSTTSSTTAATTATAPPTVASQTPTTAKPSPTTTAKPVSVTTTTQAPVVTAAPTTAAPVTTAAGGLQTSIVP